MVSRATITGALIGAAGGLVGGAIPSAMAATFACEFSASFQLWTGYRLGTESILHPITALLALPRLSYRWYPAPGLKGAAFNLAALYNSTFVTAYFILVIIGGCTGAAIGSLVGRARHQQDTLEEQQRANKIGLFALGILVTGFAIYNQVLVRRVNLIAWPPHPV